MSFANINIGTTPGDHSGDPLRVAFNKINNNFQQITNGNVALNINAPVMSVAGRTGNVILTANDVIGSVTQGDVTAALNEFGQDYAQTTYVDASFVQLVDGAPSNLNTLGKIASSLGNNASLSNTLNGYITSLNGQVSALWANALVQTDAIAVLNLDIAAANAAIAQNAANIQVLFANASSQAEYLSNLTSNASSQAGELATLTANAVAQQNSLAALNSNAAAQDASLSSLLSNAVAQQDSLSNLLGNAVSQQDTLSTILANIVVIESEIAGSNAAIITANTAMKDYVVAQDTLITNAWTANAATQAAQIVAVNDAVAGANAAIITANTAMKDYVVAQDTLITNSWTANAAAQQGLIATLQGQVYTNSNVAAYLPTHTGNVSAGNIVVVNADAENRLLGNLVIGATQARSAGTVLAINEGANNPFNSFSTVHISGSSSRTTQVTLDNASADRNSSIQLRTTRGSYSAPLPLQTGDILGSFVGRGWGLTSFATSATAPGMYMHASSNFTDVSQPTYVTISTVRPNSNAAVVHTKFESNGNLVVANGSPSTSFTTGALVVFGGAGIVGNINNSGSISSQGSITTGGNVIAGGTISSNGAISTLSTITSVGAIYTSGSVSADSYFFANGTPLSLPFNNAAADTHIQNYGKNAYIANVQMSNSTLTGDGSGLPLNIDFPQTNISHILKVADEIVANANIDATSAYNGALVIPNGGAGIQGNLFVAAKPNSRFQVGQGGTYFTNVIAQFTSDKDGPGQINMQNIRTSANAASEIVASADDGTQYTHYAKLGICNSIYSNPVRTAYKPLDAYLNADGGNLLISAERAGTSIKFVNGGYATSNVIGTWDANVLAISTAVTLTSAIQFANLTTAQINSIASPQPGMTVYNFNSGNIQVYNGTKWANITLS